MGQYAYPMHFRSLGLLMMTSATLAQAFEALPNYSALVSNSASIKLQRTPDRLGFTISPLPGVDISPMSIDAFFATLVHHGELILGHEKFVLSVELMRAEPKNLRPWQSCLSCPISFDKQENLMNTELSITLLSDKLGYTSLTNFSRAFHRWHGTSPAAFRHRSKP
ncbi:Transcriptional Regulator, AraC family protein [Shewanella benthica KT99]|uniref:Transcriptional Regulator, AraC family protein n=1 Tax=Shewanella benthica KT99 TaxID=314608 RepID=A9D1N5_9GAMM|nr:Transcriptional Regulator, AraC family protein [Shewanella benthica KT99]